MKLPLGLLGPLPLNGIPDDALQQESVYLALDQVILRSGGDGFLAQMLVGQPGQDDHGYVR